MTSFLLRASFWVDKVGRRNILVETMKKTVMSASFGNPRAHNAPIAAEHHKVAAVFNPLTVSPSFMITPPPRKPIPLTIYEVILPAASPPILMAISTKAAEPMQTKVLVRRPAFFLRHCLSKPMPAPRQNAVNKRTVNSNVFITFPFFTKPVSCTGKVSTTKAFKIDNYCKDLRPCALFFTVQK